MAMTGVEDAQDVAVREAAGIRERLVAAGGPAPRQDAMRRSHGRGGGLLAHRVGSVPRQGKHQGKTGNSQGNHAVMQSPGRPKGQRGAPVKP